MASLAVSKLHVYGFYYDVLKDKYKGKIKMVYTDADRNLNQPGFFRL